MVGSEWWQSFSFGAASVDRPRTSLTRSVDAGPKHCCPAQAPLFHFINSAEFGICTVAANVLFLAANVNYLH